MSATPDRLKPAIDRLRALMATEKEAGDTFMRKPWSAVRDTFANQHYYAADVLQDAIEELEQLDIGDANG